ncbi:MAG: hypothetical protein IIA67_02840 [Planctomycetes bacterium]|nr:hypothetical protein [Planctomycetota bacterium]
MNLFKKKKSASQLADNGRPLRPADASVAARRSVPFGGQAPVYRQPEVSYTNSTERDYQNTGSGSYRGYGEGGPARGGSYAGPTGNGDFYGRERAYRDDHSASSRGGALADGGYTNLGSGRGGTPQAGSGDSYARQERSTAATVDRYAALWDSNTGGYTNTTGRSSSPAYRGDRYDSSTRQAPRSDGYDGSTGSGDANRWSNDNYDRGPQTRRDAPAFDNRFSKGGDSYGGLPSRVDSSRRSGYDSTRNAGSSLPERAGGKAPEFIRRVSSDPGYGNAARFGNETGANSGNRLAPYRTNTDGDYTPGSTAFDSGAARNSKSSSGVMLTGGASRSPSSNSPPRSKAFDRAIYTEPRRGTEPRGGESNRFQQPPASDSSWRDERSSAPAYRPPAGSSTRGFRADAYGDTNTASGSGTRYRF